MGYWQPRKGLHGMILLSQLGSQACAHIPGVHRDVNPGFPVWPQHPGALCSYVVKMAGQPFAHFFLFILLILFMRERERTCVCACPDTLSLALVNQDLRHVCVCARATMFPGGPRDPNSQSAAWVPALQFSLLLTIPPAWVQPLFLPVRYVC